MKLAGYLRYSPGGESDSLDIQRDAITAWADASGHVIVSWHEDAGISGGESLDVRVGLFDALETVKSGLTDGIAVRELARFARDQVAQEVMFRDLRDIGGRLFSTKASENELLDDDGTDPGRELVRGILGLIAQYEKKVVVARMAMGRRHAAKVGKFAYGARPYGSAIQEHDSGKGSVLVPDESAQRVIARMRELRAEGLTYAEITGRVNMEGFPGPRGGIWHPSSTYRVLTRAEVNTQAT